MYVPIRQTDDFSAVELVVRTSLPEETAGTAIREALKPLDTNLGATEFRSVQQLVDKATSPRRFVVMMLAGFSSFALVLAALGIYAVISYSVQQRTQEIGIRTALGASPGSLQARIILETLRLAAIGLVIGLGGSLILTRSLSSLLFGVESYDPASFIGTVVVLVVVATVGDTFLQDVPPRSTQLLRFDQISNFGSLLARSGAPGTHRRLISIAKECTSVSPVFSNACVTALRQYTSPAFPTLSFTVPSAEVTLILLSLKP